MVTVRSTPLDAPLFQIDPARGVEYWGCRAVLAAFEIAGDVSALVPRGLHLGHPAVGAVLVADYGASTLGPYREFVSLLAVSDQGGQAGFYVPYIYVTGDAALAAGREVLGAPKKLADVDVRAEPAAVLGTLARPSGQVLASLSVAPLERLPAETLDALLPEGTPFFSLRHLPGPPGATQVSELVRWRCDLAVRQDAFGDHVRFSGPGSLAYPARSALDPVHHLEVGTLLAAAYLEFDMHLSAQGVVWSDTQLAGAAAGEEPSS